MIELNEEQKKCLKEINSLGNKFSVTLLQGITGSGKTIVYFEKIKENISKGKQSLVLLPEIFLTNQFSQRFEDFFGFKPAIWHSKITKKNKRSVWSVTKKPYKGAHFATFPPELIEPCIKAGSEVGDIILDPFMGSGTTAMVSKMLDRYYIGCELHEDYGNLIQERVPINVSYL